MKQKFTLTAAILTLIEFVCLCVPFSLVEVIYYRSSNGIGHTPTYLIIPIFLVFGRAKGDSWVRYSLLCYWLPSHCSCWIIFKKSAFKNYAVAPSSRCCDAGLFHNVRL